MKRSLCQFSKSQNKIATIAFPPYSSKIRIQDHLFNFSKNIDLLPEICKRYYGIISLCNIPENNKCYLTVYEGQIDRIEYDHNATIEYQRKNPKYFRYADIHDTFVASSLLNMYLIGDKKCDLKNVYDLTQILQKNKYFKEEPIYSKIDRNYYFANNTDFKNLFDSSENIFFSDINDTQTEKNTLYKIPKNTPYKLMRANDTIIGQILKLVVI
jgi:hypothetical protein